MKKIQKSFSIGQGCFESQQKTDIDSFLNLSIEDFLIEHHRRNAKNSCFYIEDHKETQHYMLIVSQDIDLIKELDMKIPNSKKTVDLFSQTQQNDFTSIKLTKLVQQLDNNQGDYELELDNRNYSFRLIKGIKVKNNLEKIDLYLDESNNILEYTEKEQTYPKYTLQKKHKP